MSVLFPLPKTVFLLLLLRQWKQHLFTATFKPHPCHSNRLVCFSRSLWPPTALTFWTRLYSDQAGSTGRSSFLLQMRRYILAAFKPICVRLKSSEHVSVCVHRLAWTFWRSTPGRWTWLGALIWGRLLSWCLELLVLRSRWDSAAFAACPSFHPPTLSLGRLLCSSGCVHGGRHVCSEGKAGSCDPGGLWDGRGKGWCQCSTSTPRSS